MNNDQFLSDFKRHLLVGEPKRSEIIKELQGHLTDLEPGAEPAGALGQPNKLARKYNATHIGWLHSRLLLFSTPFVALALIYFGVWMAHRLERVCISNEYGGCSTPLTVVPFFILGAILIWLCIIVGRALAKMNRPWRIVATLASVLWLASTGVQLWFDWNSQRGFIRPEVMQRYTNGPNELLPTDLTFTDADLVPFNWQSFFFQTILANSIFSGAALVVVWISLVLTRPFDEWRIRHRQLDLFLEGLFSILAVTGVFWFTIEATMAIFNPDVVQAYHNSTLVRLFSSDFGRWLPTVILEVPLVTYLMRRIQCRWKSFSSQVR